MAAHYTDFNDNLAYDLSLFEEKKEKPAPEPQKEEDQTPHRKRNTLKLLKIAAAVAICGILAGALLWSNATLAELNSTAISLQKELDKLKDEETRLNVELDSRVCMKDIDEYITKDLGMVKLEKYQVNYIDLSDGDSMVINDTDNGIAGRIHSIFAAVKEYFN